MFGIGLFVSVLLMVSLILLGLTYLEDYMQDYKIKYSLYEENHEEEEDYSQDFSSRLDKESAELFNKLNYEEII